MAHDAQEAIAGEAILVRARPDAHIEPIPAAIFTHLQLRVAHPESCVMYPRNLAGMSEPGAQRTLVANDPADAWSKT